MKVGVIGGLGFFGRAFVERFNAIPIVRGMNMSMSFDIIINANGNSKKYIANQNPHDDFGMSVSSVNDFIHNLKYDHFIHISSCEVYSRQTHEDSVIDHSSLTPYAFHKFMAELLVKKYCKSFIIVRSGGCVGPGMTKGPIYDLLRGEPLRVHPNSRIPYLNIYDLVSAIESLIRHQAWKETFNICGYDAPMLSEMFEINEESSAPLVSYHININKVLKYCNLPDTRTVIRRFLETQE